MWHGGVFETGNNGQLRYRNGEGRTFSIDPDELCSFYLVELVMKCARYDGRIKGFLYLVLGLSMVDGLRKVTDDESMRDVIQVAEKPDSPIPINDPILDYSTESDHEDPPYNPLVDKGKGVSSKPFFGEVYLDHSDEDVESDGEQGADSIVSSVSTVLPRAEHRHCARHIFAHWHKKYRGDEMKLLFWAIAKSYNEVDYEENMAKLSSLNVDAANDFKLHRPQLFCRAFLNPAIKTDAITSNIAETFNGFIIQARTKHLLYMLEEIRTSLMQRLVVKR
uniref:PB1-like domain-containing protein n=1 Tax=Chenopodium quinoa TaxID=63459 RepID=A0A803N241_CHEQI